MSFVLRKMKDDQHHKNRKGNQLLMISEHDEENKFN
jgi:hypothetical protein